MHPCLRPQACVQLCIKAHLWNSMRVRIACARVVCVCTCGVCVYVRRAFVCVTLPLAAVSMVEASSHCWDSRCPRVNQRGYRLGTMEIPWWGWPTSPEPPDDSSTGSLLVEGRRVSCERRLCGFDASFSLTGLAVLSFHINESISLVGTEPNQMKVKLN
jgi:hypothetical protein